MGKSTEAAIPSKSDKSSAVQEQPATQSYPDWAVMQAYHGPGVAMPPYFSAAVACGHAPHPFIWGTQPLMAPFGTPYAAIYPHGVYPHPSIVPLSQAHCQGVAASSAIGKAVLMATPLNTDAAAKSSSNEDRSPIKKLKGINSAAANGNGKTENSAEDTGHKSSRCRENDAEDSTEGSNECNESSAKKIQKRSIDGTPASGKDGKGEMPVNAMHLAVINGNINTSLGADIEEKPLVNIASTNTTTRLEPNVSTSGKPFPVSPGAIVPVHDGAANKLSLQDERALKQERRKQSNRESARRSRLRKQAETEEHAMKVELLAKENASLRSEISHLKEKAENLRLDNASLMEKLNAKLSIGKVAINEPEESRITDTVGTENLLSKLNNNSSSDINTGQWENVSREFSNGKLHQLLDTSPRTDAVAAG